MLSTETKRALRHVVLAGTLLSFPCSTSAL